MLLLGACADDFSNTPGLTSTATGQAQASSTGQPTTTEDGSSDTTQGSPDTTSGGPTDSTGPEASSGTETGGSAGADLLLCFSQITDEVMAIDLSTPDRPSSETIPTNYRVTSASVIADVYTLMIRRPSGDGGVVRFDLGADPVSVFGSDFAVSFGVPLPAQFHSSAPSTAGIVFSGEAPSPLVCSHDDASDCSEGSSPEAPGVVACSDDGTCIASGQTNGALRSTDGGLTFTKQTNDFILGPIVAGPTGLYVAFDNYNLDLEASLDGGSTWQTATQPGDVQYVEPRAWAGSSFLGTSTFQSGGIFSSADGTDWSVLDPTLPVEVNGIVHTGVGDTIFAHAESTGDSFVSEDGFDFSAVPLDTSFFTCPGVVVWLQ